MSGDKVLTSVDNYITQRGEKRIISMSITNIVVKESSRKELNSSTEVTSHSKILNVSKLHCLKKDRCIEYPSHPHNLWVFFHTAYSMAYVLVMIDKYLQ
jgi:hypothetical protein